jgi:hypothetical protein
VFFPLYFGYGHAHSHQKICNFSWWHLQSTGMEKKLIPSKQSQQTKIPSGNLSHSYWTNGHRNISCSHSTLWFSVMSTFTRGYTTWIHIEPPCFLGSFLIGTPGLGTLHRAQCGLNEALGQVEPWAPGYSERIDSEWSHCRDWAYVCRILWRRSVMGVYVMYVWDIYIYYNWITWEMIIYLLSIYVYI